MSSISLTNADDSDKKDLFNADDSDKKDSKRTNRLKRRLDKDTTMEDLLQGWTQCCYLVPRKQKLCNVARSMNSMFCGNHQPAESVVRDENDNETDSAKDTSKKERVPCPIDPTHTIYKHSLKYHIKVCTKLKQSAAMSEQVFYREDCNSYSATCLPCEKSFVTSEQTLLETAIDPDVLAAKVNAAYARIQAQCTEPEDVATFQDTPAPTTSATTTGTTATNTSNTTTNNINTTASTLDYSSADADTTLAAKIATKLGQDLTSFSKMRHVDQDILLVQQMRDRGLIKTHTADSKHSSNSAVYVELGAGRGLLSYAVSCADPTATVVLVERYGSKKKIDKALKEDLAELKIATSGTDSTSSGEGSAVVTGDIKRVRMDIRHCYLPLLPGVVGSGSDAATPNTSTTSTTSTTTGKQPVVVIAKHLCGVATDLAIQSVHAFPHIPRVDGAAKTAHAAHEVGIAIATCCHHACHFPDYTGREWYLSQGFTESEFEILKKWSGWSTNTVAVNNSNSAAKSASDATAATSTTNNADSTNTTTTTTEHAAPLNPQVIRPAHITSAEMQTLGFRVKRIIDQGRAEYINAHYTMRAKQVRYCERRLSPECVLLVATQL